LQQRFVMLVEAQSGSSPSVAAGIHGVPGLGASLASTQAAYRFYHNPRVTLRGLARPLLELARAEVPGACDRYVLIVHDWTPLSFGDHSSKQDRIPFSAKNPEGYDLQSALAVSDRDGLPIAPLMACLRAADGVHCSRSRSLRAPLSQLDELEPAMDFVERQRLGRPTIHLVDAEADSVAHYRLWSSTPDRCYLVRGDDRIVEAAGAEQKWTERRCSVIQQELRESGEFRYSREVLYHGKKAEQFVAETPVRLLRPGYRNRPNSNDRQRIYGPPLPLRLVISEVRSPAGELLVTWFLFTNAPRTIDTATITLWYYWRWNIESFFKLLKSAGIQAEHWQQVTAGAIARRLLVASMACVVAWRLARSEHPQASDARQLLVRLSGRQMKRGTKFTAPALLAGLWTMLAMLHTLEEYTPADLQALAQIALGKPP
jgi:hypothetical protein